MKNIRIYGAGMSGLLAAHMLRRFEPVVYEAAAELPNNHAALLRFRSNAVAEATGIPFKKVWVQKAVMSNEGKLQDYATIRDQNCYSLKVSGEVKGRSITNLAPGERYIAPEDFISQLSKGLNIQYSSPLERIVGHSNVPMISTIPMNMLMKIAGWSDMPEFKYQEITTITATITDPKIEIYQTIYYPYGVDEAYRASITGDKLIIEFCANREDLSEEDSMIIAQKYIKDFIGRSVYLRAVSMKSQKYGKLVNSTGRAGREFVLAMTDVHNLYSLGRFATWRQLLMDDVVKDVKVIERMIEQRDSYSRRLRDV